MTSSDPLLGTGDRPSAHAHRLVRDTAVAMAHELYDTMMLDNEWYALWKRRNPDVADQPRQLAARFVARNLSKLIPQARATLAGMLRTSTDDSLRDEIAEALILDASLRRGRGH